MGITGRSSFLTTLGFFLSATKGIEPGSVHAITLLVEEHVKVGIPSVGDLLSSN